MNRQQALSPTVPSPPTDRPTSSHRLKSLSVIGGFLDGARFEFADGLNCLIGGRGTGKALATIAGRVAFLERLVADILSFSGRLSLDRRRERLLDIITEACHMARCGGACQTAQPCLE